MYTILAFDRDETKIGCSGRYFPRSNESPINLPNHPRTVRSIPIYPRLPRTISDHFRSLRSMLRPCMLRKRSKKVFDMSKTFFDLLRINRTVRSTRNQCPTFPIDPELYPDHQHGSGKGHIFWIGDWIVSPIGYV